MDAVSGLEIGMTGQQQSNQREEGINISRLFVITIVVEQGELLHDNI